jgi:hypothetical protein
MTKKRANPTNNPIEIANTHECYGFSAKNEEKNEIPKWMDEVITKRKEHINPDKFKNLWP